MRSEVLTSMRIQIMVFWGVRPLLRLPVGTTYIPEVTCCPTFKKNDISWHSSSSRFIRNPKIIVASVSYTKYNLTPNKTQPCKLHDYAASKTTKLHGFTIDKTIIWRLQGVTTGKSTLCHCRQNYMASQPTRPYSGVAQWLVTWFNRLLAQLSRSQEWQ